MQRVCVQWPRLGPYHLARLRATYERLAREGVTLTALETASSDTTYAWREERGAFPFERMQVFSGRTVEELKPRLLHHGVTAVLDQLDPSAVAINSYSAPDAQATLLWCRRHRRPAIVMMESQAGDAPRHALRERVKATVIGAFDAALAGGSPQRTYLEQLGFPPSAIFIPYDVVDNAYFAKGAARARASPSAWAHLPGLDDPTPFFLASARFVVRKNFGLLLDAYAGYRRGAEAKGIRPWRLVLLGDGPERANLEGHATSTSGVTFAGFRQIEELPTYYGCASAFVHPPLVEPWGLVVNEAMAAGLPVLVSERCGCAPDLVREGENGFQFNPEDEGALTRLLGLMSSPNTDRAVMGRRSEEFVGSWSPERFADALWAAIRAGAARADRPAPPVARLLLWAMRTASREVHTFHVLKE